MVPNAAEESRNGGVQVSKLLSYSLDPLQGNIGDRLTRSFQAPKRIATNFLGLPERQQLNQLCTLMPYRGT